MKMDYPEVKVIEEGLPFYFTSKEISTVKIEMHWQRIQGKLASGTVKPNMNLNKNN